MQPFFLCCATNSVDGTSLTQRLSRLDGVKCCRIPNTAQLFPSIHALSIGLNMEMKEFGETNFDQSEFSGMLFERALRCMLKQQNTGGEQAVGLCDNALLPNMELVSSVMPDVLWVVAVENTAQPGLEIETYQKRFPNRILVIPLFPTDAEMEKIGDSIRFAQGEIQSLTMVNARGSIQHYFHFFLGGLVPFIDHASQQPAKTRYHISSNIGPMSAILDDLPMAFVDERPESATTKALPKGYDCFLDDDIPSGTNQITPEIRDRVLDFFESTLPPEIADIPTPEVLIIERAMDDFYSSEDAEVKTSGAERRYIANHTALVQLFQRRFANVQNYQLERMGIYLQYHLFRNAKMVVAQHGAALANIFFMRKGTRVLEIAPPWGRSQNMFRNLAGFCELKYQQVYQETNFS
ncbi:MAG: glycosyltransferase family 61 protein, partial [Verrucomicrobiota bacterium]